MDSPTPFQHTNRPGFWLGLLDFCTFGLFFLFYMLLLGPAVATGRFFDTLNKIERKLNSEL